MKTLTINGEIMKSKQSLYIHLSRVFSLPAHFGYNLDALWDILNETDEPTQIKFLNSERAVLYLGEYGESLIHLFKKLDSDNKKYTVLFM